MIITPLNFNQRANVSAKKTNRAPQFDKFIPKDTVSFGGVNKILYSAINKKAFPDSLYLRPQVIRNIDVFSGDLPGKIGELVAKRMDYLERTQKAVLGSYSYSNNKFLPKVFNIHERQKKAEMLVKKPETFEIDWSNEYNQIQEVLKSSTSDSINFDELIEVLKNINIVKP